MASSADVGDSSLRYPRDRSFIVDMNNRPLYESDERPTPKKNNNVVKTENANPPPLRQATTSSTVYYPPKSPMAPPPTPNATGGDSLFGFLRLSEKAKLGLFLGFVVIAVFLYAALLAVQVETRDAVNKLVEQNSD